MWRFGLLMLAAGMAHAQHVSVFETPAYRIALPGHWEQQPGADGDVTYRNTARTEAITMALYEHAALGEPRRMQVLETSVKLRRELERTLAARPPKLTPVTRRLSGGLLHLRYAGEEPGAGRRFVNVTVSSPNWLQNFYYEAVGLDPAEFAASVRTIFAGLEVPPPDTLLTSNFSLGKSSR